MYCYHPLQSKLSKRNYNKVLQTKCFLLTNKRLSQSFKMIKYNGYVCQVNYYLLINVIMTLIVIKSHTKEDFKFLLKLETEINSDI